jgi:uncharacterized protein YegJ (DUF2314 family)
MHQNSSHPLDAANFSKLSAMFIRGLGEVFSSQEDIRLWPLSDSRGMFLRKFWDAAATDFGAPAPAISPEPLSIDMMREENYLLGLLQLPTMEGSICFSAGLWMLGPVAFGENNPYQNAQMRFFAMAEQVGSDSEARIYEMKDGDLEVSCMLARADVGLFLDTLVDRYLSGQLVATVRKGDAEMAAAMETAMSQVPYFINILENYPAVEQYSIKIRVEDKGEVEYFWLENTRWQAGHFHGTVGNDPTLVKSVTYGQSMAIAPSGVYDWYYMWDGKMRGNYTLRAGLPYMDPNQAAKLLAILDES